MTKKKLGNFVNRDGYFPVNRIANKHTNEEIKEKHRLIFQNEERPAE